MRNFKILLMSDHIHMSVKLNNKFYTLILYIYLHIYQERCFDKKNIQAVLIYQLIHKFKYWKLLQLLFIILIKTCRSVDVEGHSSKKWISSSILFRSHLLHNLLLTSNFKYLPVSIFSLWEDILNLVMALLNVKLSIICR